jgi:hypothetical protein
MPEIRTMSIGTICALRIDAGIAGDAALVADYDRAIDGDSEATARCRHALELALSAAAG